MTATIDPGVSPMPGPIGPQAQLIPPAIPPAPPVWGKQASFVQPHQPAFWLYCALLTMGGYLFIQEQFLMSSLMTAYLLSWALVLAYAVPVAFVIYKLDLFEREPKLLLAAAVVWGGVIATSLAAQANEAWLSILGKVASPDFAAQWGAAVVGPGVEETLKLMGVVTIYLIVSSEFDGVLDGFVYGAMVGLGFTVVEDVGYFINAVAAVPGAVDQSGPVFDTFLIRVVGGGLYGHVLFTGLTGTGFAFFVTQRAAAMPRRVMGAALCIVAGVSAHVVWNSPWMDSILQTTGVENPSVLQWIEYGTLKGLPFLLLLGLLVVLATRSEENNYRSIVAGEPDPWVVTDDEIRSLRSLRARRSARSTVGRLRGPAGARATGRLQAAQIEYAMVRSRAGSLSDPALEAQRLKIRSIRSEIAVLPFLPAPAIRPPALAPGVAPAWAPGVAPAPQPMPGSTPAVGVPWPAVVQPAAAADQPTAAQPAMTSTQTPATQAPAAAQVASGPTLGDKAAPEQAAPDKAASVKAAPDLAAAPVKPPSDKQAPVKTAPDPVVAPVAGQPAPDVSALHVTLPPPPVAKIPRPVDKVPLPMVEPVAVPIAEPAVTASPDEPLAAVTPAAPAAASPAEPAAASQAEPAPVVAPMPADPAPAAPAPVTVSASASPAPALPVVAPVWTPTHVVPAGGIAAWDAPDPRRQPVAMLSARVELVVVGQAGAWAQVRGVNGWTGWVDGRLLVGNR